MGSKTGEEERTREREARLPSPLYGLLSLGWMNERIPSGYLKHMVVVEKLSQCIQHIVKLLIMKPYVGCLRSWCMLVSVVNMITEVTCMVQQFEQHKVHCAGCKSKKNPEKAGSRLPSAHRFELRPLRRQKETLKEW